MCWGLSIQSHLSLFCCDAGQPGPSDIAVPVLLGAAGLATPGLAGQLSEAYEVACSRQAGPGAGQLLQASGATSFDPASGGLELRGLAAQPAPVLSFRPILAKSVSPQPLARALQDSLRLGAAPGGFQVCLEGSLFMHTLLLHSIPICVLKSLRA